MPSQPSNLFPRPFAAGGNYQIIPDSPAAAGRASWQAGFPPETQLPLSQGGIAPNRLDFNGLFYMLSAFACWQQSGGQWTYKPGLNYSPPAIVFYQGKLWWCLADNGPDSALAAPGSNRAVWLELLTALAQQMGSGGASAILGNPVGAVIMYYGTAAPEGYLPCNGAAFSASTYPLLYAVLGKATTPDMRGLFVRGYDTRNSVDPSGASRGLGSAQGDAIRNIPGSFGADIGWSDSNIGLGVSGAFYEAGPLGSGDTGGYANEYRKYVFDPSRVVPTAPENRPVNINLLYCIKHD
jgi:hypothetical protein